VLLVDDHQGVLDRVSSMLADTYDVVGAVTDGRHTPAIARRLAPDAIVMDINMPGLDGFETMRELDLAGSRAPVVFLSLMDDDGHIVEAFRRGGRGYVVKSRMLRDLPIALDQVLRKRRFPSSLPSLHQIDNEGGHAMHLYGDAQSFAADVAALLDAALRRGDATGLIATAEVCDGVARHLRDRGWDVGASGTLNRYRAMEARAALDDLLRDGLPDAARVAAIVDELDEYRRTVAGPSSCLTIAGNLSASLLAAGNLPGARAQEHLWESLTKARPFFTLCGYSTSCFRGDAPDAWPMVADEHSALCLGNEL
jgi:DNA-binding response OmpR family regulator